MNNKTLSDDEMMRDIKIMSDEEILCWIYKMASERPELTPRMVDYINKGLSAAFSLSKQQCSDMETALSMALFDHYKNPEKFKKIVAIKEKLNSWPHKFLKWDWLLETKND